MSISLSSGAKMPLLGLGTWQTQDVGQVIKVALDIGYRHIDCAALYGNEAEVGVALQEKFASDVKREDVFITSKLWNTCHKRDLVKPAVQKALSDLKLDYLDLFLIHFPVAFQDNLTEYGFPRSDDGKLIFSDTDFVDTWAGMEELVDQGLVKTIGISNFTIEQTQRVLDMCRIKPAVNQLELHPFNTQPELVAFCESKGIALTAYGSFGSPGRPWLADSDPKPLQDPTVASIAGKYKKTSAQVLLRYWMDKGIPVVPKSANADRLKENFNVFDFNLTKEDISTLDKLNTGAVLFPWEEWKPSKYYPF